MCALWFLLGAASNQLGCLANTGVSVQPLQRLHPPWTKQLPVAFSWLLVMIYQYLQPAVAESVWCCHYWMMLVQHDPVERYKLGFIHRLPEMCCAYFSEADPVDWRITFAVMHFSLSTVALWEAEPVSAMHHRALSLLPLCGCLRWNCDCQAAWLLRLFACCLLCKGCQSRHLTSNWTQQVKATDRLLGILHLP